MPAPLSLALDHPDLLIGWVTALGVRVEESDEALRGLLRQAVDGAGDTDAGADVRAAIRDLLRGHGYKPSGRGKPASEFLASAAARDEFPVVFNVVDVNNLVSLETGWPSSVFDLERARDGEAELEVRLGRPGEGFVFNDAGQRIDIGGLLSVARRGGDAIGNPVKDCSSTKVGPDTRAVLGVVYTSRRVADREDVAAVVRRFGELLARHAHADEIATGVLADDSP